MFKHLVIYLLTIVVKSQKSAVRFKDFKCVSCSRAKDVIRNLMDLATFSQFSSNHSDFLNFLHLETQFF